MYEWRERFVFEQTGDADWSVWERRGGKGAGALALRCRGDQSEQTEAADLPLGLLALLPSGGRYLGVFLFVGFSCLGATEEKVSFVTATADCRKEKVTGKKMEAKTANLREKKTNQGRG